DANKNGRFADDPPLFSFFPYPPGFTGGVRVAASDVDVDGRAELITAAGPGGGPHVRIFKFNGTTFVPIDEFFAYPPGFRGGVFVAAGPIAGAGTTGAEVITGAGAGGGPHVRIFTDANGNGKVSDDPVFDEFFAYAPGFTGGVVVAAGDTDHSGVLVEV